MALERRESWVYAQREEYRQKIQIGRALDGADEATVRSRIALLARTIFAEAANHYRTQGAMEGIGWAAVNRVGAPRFPNTLEAVIYKPEQFAVGNVRWNMAADPDKLTGPDARAYEQALNVARGILTGKVPDPIGGARFFYSSRREEDVPKGFFADGLRENRLLKQRRIGHFTFVREAK